ncbi:hypothetical protein KC19_VG232900 [Ceratodon purpureus]|uniref:Uncharacterized protein n=1 Tax=Ceratodon purpureus TaxID=3225 RepID=A0A8T0HUD4_CERPU|nr:hypothetical protein KC19_VG232900 [Ceratodon purpureus]
MVDLNSSSVENLGVKSSVNLDMFFGNSYISYLCSFRWNSDGFWGCEWLVLAGISFRAYPLAQFTAFHLLPFAQLRGYLCLDNSCATVAFFFFGSVFFYKKFTALGWC